MAGHGSSSADYLRKSFILLILFGGLFLLFHYPPEIHEQRPTSLLAPGFVVLGFGDSGPNPGYFQSAGRPDHAKI